MKKSEKNKEKTIEQINEEFKLLYEDKENFNELNTILSKDNKIFLIDKYALQDELWNKMLLKYNEEILKQKEESKLETEVLQNGNSLEILKYFIFHKFKNLFISTGVIGSIVLLLKLIILILTKDSIKSEEDPSGQYCENYNKREEWINLERRK